MIKVKYADGETETVPASALNELINLREIVAFQRAEGWVAIGQAPLRKRLRPIQGPGQRAYDIYLDEYRNRHNQGQRDTV